jgi:hypothetical protein
MAITGTQIPQGTINSQEAIYLEGGPDVYFEDYRGNYRFNPDSDGFFYGLSGTATYPAFNVGCYENFHFMDNVTMNDVQCDAIGVVDTLQKRNYLDITFDIKSMLPFTTLRHYLKGGGAVTTSLTDEAEKFGLGPINNAQAWKVYFYRIYDEEAGDFVSVTLHKAKFVDAWDWNWQYANAHMINVTMRAFADTNRPAAQRFATIIRSDPSVL